MIRKYNTRYLFCECREITKSMIKKIVGKWNMIFKKYVCTRIKQTGRFYIGARAVKINTWAFNFESIYVTAKYLMVAFE